MDTGQILVKQTTIDLSDELNCLNVEEMIKAKEAIFKAFMLARQLTQWGLECLNKKIKNLEEDEFPKEQEELLLKNIRYRIEDLKPSLIKYDKIALKRLGLILQEYIPGGDAAFNRNLMGALQSTYSSMYDRLRNRLPSKGGPWVRNFKEQVAQADGDPTIALYQPKPYSPMEEYVKLRMDVDSLLKIKSKIRQFLQESKQMDKFEENSEYDLALQRLFHITGEYLKRSDMSPSLSVETRKSLMKKGIPVEALCEYRDMLAHYQLFRMITSTIENRKELENTWRGVERVLEIEILEMEENFFNRLINKKMETAERRMLKDIFEKIKTKSVTCLSEKVELEMKEGTSKNLWSPETVEELSQYAAKMTSIDFSKGDQFEIIPNTKNVIVDFIIASNKKLYGDIHEKLKEKIDQDKYPLLEEQKNRVKAILKNHEYDMEIMKVRTILFHGGTAETESLQDFFRKLPADIFAVNEANEYIRVKDELKRYFNSEEISKGLAWDPPNEEKMTKARALLQNDGEQGKRVMDFLTTLNKSQEGEVITFTPNDYIDAVDKLKVVDENSKEILYSISIDWKKNKCAELLYHYFKGPLFLYDVILAMRDKNKGMREAEKDTAKALFKEILPITADIYAERFNAEIKEMIRLENASALESQVINVVELWKRIKALSKQQGKSNTTISKKRKHSSIEASDMLVTTTEQDLLQFRNYLGHGDALVTPNEQVKMAKEMVELKDNIKPELAKAAEGSETVELDEIAGIINRIYPAGALAIKEILCPNSGKPNERDRKGRKVESCLTWEDIEEVVDDPEDLIDPGNMKIDSEKMMNVLNREIDMNEEKFKNYIVLTTESEIKGRYRNELVRILHHKNAYSKHLDAVEKFSGAVMHTMMAKHILGEILRGDYKGAAVDLGFFGGSLILGEVSKIVARNGAIFFKEGSVLLGKSLKLASPLLARGVSVFIAYDLWNQVKALKSGDKDAIVSVAGDSIYLAVDAAEVGIEISEGLSLIVGVSAVTGPIGMAIGATVFVGTDIYQAVKAVAKIDNKIHLNGSERFIEGLRAFIGMNPSLYIENIIEEKDWNNAVVQNSVRILKLNPNIQRYVFPSYVQVGCHEPMSASHSIVRLARMVDDIEWSRSRPDDVPEVNIFCKPKGRGERVPNGWTYYCENAIGVEYYSKDRTDNYTLINLGNGDDWVEGFQESGNIFIIDRGNKTFVGGSKDDSFIFHRAPTVIQAKKKNSCDDPIFDLTSSKMVGDINGAGGINTIDVEGLRLTADSGKSSNVEEVIVDFPQKSLTYTDQVAFNITNINKFLGMTQNPDRVVAACDTKFVDGRGGYNEHAQDAIRIPHLNCSFNATVIINPFTIVKNDALAGNFQYFIQGDTGKTSKINLKGSSKTRNTFTFKYALDDLAAIEKSKDTVKFSFIKEFYHTFDSMEKQNSFNLTISERIEGNTYLLMDNTRIVVGKHNLYAMQNTERAINSIVEAYTDITMNLNMYLVVHSNNEVLTIAGPLNDVLTNDPTSETSHFVSGAGVNIFSIISGQDKLTMRNLPINDVIIHYFNKTNSIDRIDLRKILGQVRKDLAGEMNVIVKSVENDLMLNLFISDESRDCELLKIRLKDVIEYLWYSKIQIVLDTVFSVEESNGDFKLVPLPLIFNDPNDTLFVINPRDVAEGMKIKISKELRNYAFARKDDALIITNSLNADSHKYPLATVVLNGLYAHYAARTEICDKMASLSIEFDDTTIVLSHEIEKITKSAGDFPQMKKVSEIEAYRKLLQAMRKNRRLFEEINSNSPSKAAGIILKDREFTSGKDGWVSPLAHAVTEGNMIAAGRLIVTGGADVTVKDSYGHSPLYYAVKYQQQEIIDYFLHTLFDGKSPSEVTDIMIAITSELPVVKYVTQKLKHKNEADWRIFTKYKKDNWATLLHYAAINGNLDVVKYLIEKGEEDGNIKAKDVYGQMPMYYAVKYKHSSIADYFIQIIRTKGLLPLTFSVVMESLEIVQYLIEEKGEDIYEKDKYSKTALFYAFQNNADNVRDYLIEIIMKEGKGHVLAYPIITGDISVMKSLMKMSISVNEKNILGKTPLHYAAMYGSLEMVKLLVDRNADLKAQDKSGHTPLEYGLKSQHAKVVEYLCSKLRLDPLVTSAEAGKVRVVSQLIKGKADLNKTDRNGNTLLHLAVSRGVLELVRYLIEKGSTPDARNFDLQTPLHIAALKGNLEIVKMIIAAKADADAEDLFRRTPLHNALIKKHYGVTIYLCELKGMDASFFASKHGYLPLLKYHLEHGGNIHKRDEEQQTLLHLAARGETPDLAEYLVKNGIDPNVKNKQDQTPLHYAARFGRVEVGKCLLQNGADINARDNRGWTPLYWSIDSSKNFPLLQLLVESGSDLTGQDVLGRTPLSLAEEMDRTSEFTQYLKKKVNEKRNTRKRRQVIVDQNYRKSRNLDEMADNVWLGANTAGIGSSRWASLGFLHWGNSPLNNLLHYKADNSSQSRLSQMSPEIEASGSIMLLDLLIRKITGQKYVGNLDQVEHTLEIQAFALNVVEIFEKTLNNAAFEFGIDWKHLNFDPIALQSVVIRQLQIGESSQIPITLYKFAKKACSESRQCEQFLEYLRSHLKLGLDERNVLQRADEFKAERVKEI